MAVPDFESLRQYSEKLRSYTTEELEDIFFHVNLLREPVRYRMLLRELEARSVRPHAEQAVRTAIDLWTLTERIPTLSRHRWLRGGVVALLLAVCSMAVTLGLLLPIWLFSMPLRFIGIQTAFVYFAWAPVAPVLGLAVGGKLGGRGFYGLFVLLGVVAGLALFSATGAPRAIVQSVLEHHSAGSGGVFGGF
jgi:hypothetical protein